MDHNATIDFHGAPVNLSEEYHQARKMMGLKTTDLDTLYQTVTHIYVMIEDEEWNTAYMNLLFEIGDRQNMLIDMRVSEKEGVVVR